MTLERNASLVLVTLASIVTGCASGPTDTSSALADDFARRTGTSLAPAVGPIEQTVDRFLARPLTPDAAVRVALLNNRRVRATMAELRVAEADLAQAGLLANPAFDLELKFAEAGGGTTIEGAVVQNLLDVFTLPLRKRVAAAEFEVARRTILLALLDVARDARAALVDAQAAEAQSALRRQMLEAATLRAEFARRVRDAGNISELSLALIEADAEQAGLDAATAHADAVAARERVNVALGLFGGRTNWSAGEVAAIEATAGDDFEADVVGASVELDRDRAALAAGATSLSFQRVFAWGGGAHVGGAFEREPGDEWSLGPVIGGSIPLWDLGGTGVARARATLEGARATYHAHAVEVRSAARLARERLSIERAKLDRLSAVVGPLQERITRLSLLNYNAMQIDAMTLLNARRSELAIRSQLIDAQRRAALAANDVVHLRAGGRATLARGDSPAAMPSTPAAASH